ncbi:MAG: glycosyltransferase family 1 protein, partial [Proteobacteria bacterium]|nr:glycosyltransferase family 1 protein [Pseudomonadota bacterium]
WWPEGMGARYERWLRSLVAVADTILCISEAVARELEEWSRDAGVAPQLAQPQVKWFHLGADIERSAPSRGLPGGYQKLLTALAAAPTFLMVGTLEPRKGHAQVISGFELLWQQGHVVNLLIVGKEGWMVDALMERIDTHALLGKHLFWMSSASDQCLDDLYARSDCLLAASEGEGFGLPLIEGAQRGIPIIARDLPVFREVAGDSAFYFNGLDAEDVSSAICGWLSLRDQGKAPASDVLGWLSWHESAAQLLRALALTRDTAVRGATTQRENT